MKWNIFERFGPQNERFVNGVDSDAKNSPSMIFPPHLRPDIITTGSISSIAIAKTLNQVSEEGKLNFLGRELKYFLME